jgi:DNA-binding response OmpR family regulator
LYAHAPVRVLLLETPLRALPFLPGLFESLGHSIVTAEVAEARSAAASRGGGSADLVVIGRDAWNEEDTDLCRRLREDRLSLPILAVSGPCDARLRAAALRVGADDFISVPFDAEELAVRALALVRRTTSQSRHARAGAFFADFGRRQVFVDGRRVGLTLREFDLLATLIERSGEVLTRQDLAGPAGLAGSESNVVDVHMSRIRDKLGAYAVQIETVRGLGYRLRPS